MKKQKEIDIEKLQKIVEKNAVKNYMELVHWLYSNHLDVLREWEATKGTLQIHFANGKEAFEIKNNKLNKEFDESVSKLSGVLTK